MAFSRCLVTMAAWLAIETPELFAGVESMTVPDGFVVEVAAETPVTDRPLMGGFDVEGRLYLAEAAGVNLEAKDLLARTPNFVRRLVDADGDGIFESSTVFADKMTFPSGALPYRGSVYVASPPYIWKLTDSDGDGVAESRDILVGQFGFIGNAADIHGCFLGPNGRIYWCDGRHGHEFIDENGNVTSQGKAARIFSCRLDGSDILSHAGGGMDNPVEVDFTPQGEMLGVVNLFYQKRGDCLVHWLWGGAYPRTDQPLQIAEFRRTGDLLGPVLDFGHVAVSGMLRYRSDHFGPDYVGSWFVCEFNTHKLVRVQLVRSGSSYTARVEDFLVSTDNDFHPTDVIEDADGSLLVVDTGGWFRNGCPTSVEAKPDILGGIYRIRKKDGAARDDPRGKTLAWDGATVGELIARLGDPRPVVRERAIDTLAIRGDDAVNPILAMMSAPPSPDVARNGIWALARIGTPAAAMGIVLTGFAHGSDSRQAAIIAMQTMDVPEMVQSPLVAELYKAIRLDTAPVRREAAVALGRLGRLENVPILLNALETVQNDRSLEHAILYALIEIDAPEATREGLMHASSQVRRGALIALDQMKSGNLTRDEVAPLLDTGDASLQQAALEVIVKHPGWSEEILGLVREWINDDLDEIRASTLRGALAAFLKEETTQELVGELLGAEIPAASRKLLLDVVAQSDRKPWPESWRAGIERALNDGPEDVATSALFAVQNRPELAPAAKAIIANSKRGPAVRASAATALAKMGEPLEDAAFELLVERLAANNAALDRMAAAEAIGSANLTADQRRRLLDVVRNAGPVELPALVRAFERAPVDADLGSLAIEAIRASRGFASLSADRIIELFVAYPASVQAMAQTLAESKSLGQEERRQFATKIESQLGSGDAERGRSVFFGTKAACASCHAIAGEGGKIGPDLSKIGLIREPKVLVESVVMPSASLARGFETYNVLTAEGKTFAGLIARETASDVWLRTADRSEIRIPRDQIEELSASPRSVMPEGLEQLLTEEEMVDLVFYLSTLK